MELYRANEEASEIRSHVSQRGLYLTGLHRANEEAAELGPTHLRGGYV